MRAYYYFLLTQVFGDVPFFMTNVLPPDALKIPKTSKASIYERIVADCEIAASFLPLTYPASETGRVTKGAALAWQQRLPCTRKITKKLCDW